MTEFTVLASVDTIDWSAAVLRVIHIFAAMLAMGGACFQLVALHPVLKTVEPERRRELREAIVRRWSTIVYVCIALLLISGLINYLAFKIPQLKTSEMRGIYHGLFGVKFLAALGAFHSAAVLSLPGARGERWRDKADFWLPLLVGLLAIVALLGAALGTIRGA